MSGAPRETVVALFAIASLLVTMSAAAVGHASEAMPVFLIKALGGILEPAMIEVPADTCFMIEIEDTGSASIEFESRDLRQAKVLAGSTKSYVVVNALKPGIYTFFDDFHRDTGKVHVVVK